MSNYTFQQTVKTCGATELNDEDRTKVTCFWERDKSDPRMISDRSMTVHVLPNLLVSFSVLVLLLYIETESKTFIKSQRGRAR